MIVLGQGRRGIEIENGFLILFYSVTFTFGSSMKGRMRNLSMIHINFVRVINVGGVLQVGIYYIYIIKD